MAKVAAAKKVVKKRRERKNIEKEINGTIYKVNAYFNGQADESVLNTIFRLTKKS